MEPILYAKIVDAYTGEILSPEKAFKWENVKVEPIIQDKLVEYVYTTRLGFAIAYDYDDLIDDLIEEAIKSHEI